MVGNDKHHNACMALNNVLYIKTGGTQLTLKSLLFAIVFWSRKTLYKVHGLLSNYVFYLTHADCLLTLMSIDLLFPL